MQRRAFHLILLFTAIAAFSSACAAPGGYVRNGATMGAVAGAVIGKALGKNYEAMALGAGAGAILGGVLGNMYRQANYPLNRTPRVYRRPSQAIPSQHFRRPRRLLPAAVQVEAEPKRSAACPLEDTW